MQLFTAVLMLCVATAALAQNPSVAPMTRSHKKRMHNTNWLPEEWRKRGATLKFAPQDNSVAGRVTRFLKELFTFSPGTGFVVFTAFSDRECLHPTWESGMNVGQCMMATADDGVTLGSLRADVVMSKGEIAVKIHTWMDQYCSMAAGTMPTEEVAMVASLTCGSYKADINGQKSFSGQYSFQNLDTVPKFYHFLAHGRLELEFDGPETCMYQHFDDFENHGLRNITRYYLQATPPLNGCYQVHDATGMYTHSYKTMCSGDDNGPGLLQNVWFEDDACTKPMNSTMYVPQIFDQCKPMGESVANQQIYGGARVFHSHMLGNVPGGFHKEYCLSRGGRHSVMSPSDQVAPWNKYKDVIITEHRNCEGNHCDCTGSDCDGNSNSTNPN